MDILIYPDPRLRTPGEELMEIDDEVSARIREMFELMYAARGVGLAAVQAGWPVRLFVMNLSAEPPAEDNDAEEIVCINPRVTTESGRIVEEEGCLSFPGIRGKVIRAENVHLEYYNEQGEAMSADLSGLAAIAAQHELDHLDGQIFINRMTSASRAKVASQLKQLEKEFEVEA